MLKVLDAHAREYELSTQAGPLVCSVLKVAYSPQFKSILVADVHLGKAQAFRELGVPVPAGTTEGNLKRLSQAINQLDAKSIYFLGDLLHSKAAHKPELLAQLTRWRESHATLQMTLIRGNHDDKAGDPPSNLGIQVVEEPYKLGEFALCHHQLNLQGVVCLSGHVHPVVVLKGKGHSKARLPCFTRRDNHIVLPAFGEFTGGFVCKKEEFEDILLVANEND